jgi:hypothetical protein
MESNFNGNNIPMGLGMALSQNITALSYFASQPKDKQREIIDGTHKIKSKAEMRSYVNSLVNQNFS